MGAMGAEETITTEEWANIAASRSQVYGFLGALCCQLPDERFVSGMFGQEFAGFLAALIDADDLPEEVRSGAGLMKKFIGESKDIPADELKTKLGVERTRLLRGVKPGYGPLPPYESVYCGASRNYLEEVEAIKNDIENAEDIDNVQLVENSQVSDAASNVDMLPLTSVIKAYAEEGLVLPRDRYDQPDYIGFELDFMRHLCAKESAAWQAGDTAAALAYLNKEHAFLNEHVARWVPRFCDEMVKDARLDFYLGVARLIRGYLLDEHQKSAVYLELAEEKG